MKKTKIILGVLFIIIALGIWFSQNYTISRNYTSAPKEITKEQALKELPELEINKSDKDMKEVVFSMSEVQAAIGKDDTVTIDTLIASKELKDYIPKGHTLKTMEVMNNTVYLWMPADDAEYRYGMSADDLFFHKVVGFYDNQDGTVGTLYSNNGNESFVKADKPSLEFEITRR